MEVLIYNFVFILILGLLLKANTQYSRGKINAFVVLSFISLFVVHTFVDPMTVRDLPFYKDAFNECISLPFYRLKDALWASSMELGFLWYMKFLSLISNNFIIVLIVGSLILLSCYYRTILKYSPYTYVSILLLLVTVFDQSIFVLRQHLAMALLTLSWDSIINKNYRRFGVFIIIAFLLHRTALVFVPLFFLYNIENKRKYILALLIPCLVFGVSYIIILRYFSSLMGRDYSGYIDNVKYGGANYVDFILMSGLLASMVFFMKSAVFERGINKLLLSIISIAVIATFFGVGNSSTGRLFYYYTAIPFILVPNIMKYINNPIVRVGFAVCYIGLYVYVSYLGSAAVYFENMSFLFQTK
jgi:hypothetical protein